MALKFNFDKSLLSYRPTQQLNNIARSVRRGSQAAKARLGLLQLIQDHCFDHDKGVYVPISDNVRLNGKLPHYSECLSPIQFPDSSFDYCFFTNALSIPQAWGTEMFDPEAELAPKDRATNICFLVVTIEYDCKTTSELEECLEWTRGGDGKFSKSKFAEVDRALTGFTEYRGYSIVFTGNRSLHFHLIFCTKHLENAPWDCLAQERAAQPHAPVLHGAHKRYWETAAETFDSILKPSLTPDKSLANLTQWRRAPWAERTLQKDSDVLGLPAGTTIPQLVVHENIRSRASAKADHFLVPAEFKAPHVTPTKTCSNKQISAHVNDGELLRALEECCLEEWGEYPKPVSVGHKKNEWIIHFQNHPNDKNPSTIVKGGYRRLILCGHHKFNEDFYLPDQQNANELCESLLQQSQKQCVQTNHKPATSGCSKPNKSANSRDYIGEINERFAKPIAEQGWQKITSISRERLHQALNHVRNLSRHLLIQAPEGIGKTSGLFEQIAIRCFDAAMDRAPAQESFACFAFRSTEQAEAKAEEYRASGQYRNAVVLRSFWSQYREVCEENGVDPIPRHLFPCQCLIDILRHIEINQKAVFDALEERRKKLWEDKTRKSRFDSATTVLFTNHDLAKVWYRSHITRLWHHPDFDPASNKSIQANGSFALSEIIIDEPEMDEVLHVIPESLFDYLKKTQRRYPKWTHQSRSERYKVYKSDRDAQEIPGKRSFEEIDELMRIDLEPLEEVDVDYQAIPFGFDSAGKGIYSDQSGKRFYLGVQSWLEDCAATLTFLTTESLISEVLKRIFADRIRPNLFTLELSPTCNLFPIQVPLITDNRAARDRPRSEKITALATQIVSNNSDAIVIANRVKKPTPDPRIKTFQRAKGLNGLDKNDVYVVPICLSPDQYAELNVIGQWLAMPDAVSRFYEDQISQAVGRNTGFRKSEGTKTALICSHRLAKIVLGECFQGHSPRIRLAKMKKKAQGSYY